MAGNPMGFRSLVEQMQQRDKDTAPADGPRAGRPTRTPDRAARRRTAEEVAFAQARGSFDEVPAFLSRRWL